MSETFAELFEQSLNDIDMTPGAIVDATVVAIEPDFVIVNAGLKSEGAIPRSQFMNESGELAIAIGDSVKVALDAVEDGFGATRLSREKAKRAEAWIDLEKAHEETAVVMGIINGKVKGGFTVEIENVRAFGIQLDGCYVAKREIIQAPQRYGEAFHRHARGDMRRVILGGTGPLFLRHTIQHRHGQRDAAFMIAKRFS